MTTAVVFAYHNVGVRCLSVLLARGVDVKLVVTHDDAPGENIWFGDVRKLAADYGIPAITPADPHDPRVFMRIRDYAPDFLFSFYYRLMLKPDLLALARRGAYNMHGSLLPKYRGRVPVNWAIINGETETGATLHEMVEKPDAGHIVDQMAMPILPNDTAREVFDKVTVAAELVLHRTLPRLIAGTAKATAMDLKRGSYFGGRKAEDGRIDWRRPALEIHNLVRAVTQPYPGAFCDLPQGRLVIWRTLVANGGVAGAPALFIWNDQLFARCGDGRSLHIVSAELAGERLDAASFAGYFGKHSVDWAATVPTSTNTLP